MRVLSCGIALITGHDQNWWKESSRTAPHLTEISWQPRDSSLRPTRSRRCREQRTIHGVVLPFLKKSQARTSQYQKRTHATALMAPRTFSQRELPSRSCSRLSLKALRTRVRTYSSEFCQKTNYCLTHWIPACTAGSAL